MKRRSYIDFKQCIAYAVVAVSLLIGILIYVFFRGFLCWSSPMDPGVQAPEWIMYSLPDGLWMFSLALFIVTIWEFELSPSALLWWFCGVACGFCLEFFQLAGILPGTFDLIDLLMMSGGAIPPLFIAYRFRTQSTGAFQDTLSLINKTSR